MWLVEPTFTNHPICDSIRSSAAANCVSSSKKAIFENRESHQSVARLARANFGLGKHLRPISGSLIAAQILYAFHREGRPIKRSDAIDFIHASYLPLVDLWRGDKAFGDLLIKHKVKFSERVVSTLEELPLRIETEAARLARVA